MSCDPATWSNLRWFGHTLVARCPSTVGYLVPPRCPIFQSLPARRLKTISLKLKKQMLFWMASDVLGNGSSNREFILTLELRAKIGMFAT